MVSEQVFCWRHLSGIKAAFVLGDRSRRMEIRHSTRSYSMNVFAWEGPTRKPSRFPISRFQEDGT